MGLAYIVDRLFTHNNSLETVQLSGSGCQGNGTIKKVYISCPEAAEKWDISERRVQILYKENRIPRVSKTGYMWLIPKDAEKPFDSRKKKCERNDINGI